MHALSGGRSKLRWLPMGFGLFWAAAVAVAADHDAGLRASRVPLAIDLADMRTPKWSGGALVVWASSGTAAPRIHLIDAAGRVFADLRVEIPGAATVTIRDASYSEDGSVAFCGGITEGSGKPGSYVAWMTRTGGDLRLVRTSPYLPSSVAIARDGTIWTAGGFERRRSLTVNLDAAEGAVFRRFDRSGTLAGMYVPQTRLRDPAPLLDSGNLFAAKGERMLWYSPTAREAIEIAADGAVTTTSPLELPAGMARPTGYAVTNAGRVFLSATGNGGWMVAELDTKGRRWADRFSAATPRNALLLYGADGDRLVGGRDSRSLQFFPPRR